jgi:hypothetical protein
MGTEAFGTAPPLAPVKRDRSSFVIEPGDDLKTIWAEGREWYITPVDPNTGIPLPIAQHERLPIDDPRRANLHHGRHPGNLFKIQDSLFPDAPSPLAREAERNARLQYVNPLDHNVVDLKQGNSTYHDWFFGTMPLETEREIFSFTIPAIAGFIPQYVIDVRGWEPKVVKPTPGQTALMMSIRKPKPVTDRKLKIVRAKAGEAYKSLSDPNMDKETYVNERAQQYVDQNNARFGFPYEYFTYKNDVVKDFICDYVFKQNINVSTERVAEFLEAREANKKRFLGEKLLALAIDAATLDIADTYQTARTGGRVHRARPRSARGVVWSVLGSQNRQREYVAEQYAASLREQYGVAA